MRISPARWHWALLLVYLLAVSLPTVWAGANANKEEDPFREAAGGDANEEEPDVAPGAAADDEAEVADDQEAEGLISEENVKGLQNKWNRWQKRRGNPLYKHVKGAKKIESAWKNPYERITGVEKFWNIKKAVEQIATLLSTNTVDFTKNRRGDKILVTESDVVKKVTSFIDGYPWMFLVGGYVRDLIIPEPKESKDVDIGIMDNPEVLMGVCTKNKWKCAVERYPWFNIFKFGNPLPGYEEHVTAMEVLPSTISVGATNAWRDYTVNAVYFDMSTTVFLDPTGYGKKDCDGMRLRIANWAEGAHDDRSWYRFFEETWYVTGAGPQKIARWFHMRLKGFLGEKHSRAFVMKKMKNMSNENQAVVIHQWAHQTLNNRDTRKAKLLHMMEIFGEDLTKTVDTDKKFNSVDASRTFRKWFDLLVERFPGYGLRRYEDVLRYCLACSN